MAMKRLLLVGGGHAHVQVLAALADGTFPETDVTLLSPYPRQIYSGMLPGWIAGHYAIDDCTIRIDRLAQRAGVRLVQTTCLGVDLNGKEVFCANGEKIAFDLLSIDSGPVVDLAALPGAAQHALPLRPIEEFVAAWPGLLDKARQQTEGFRLAIVGDGAAGTELAFALQARFAAEQAGHVSLILIGSHDLPLPGFPLRLRRQAASLLKTSGIVHLPRQRAAGFTADRVLLAEGRFVASDASLIVTGAAAPHWPASSGLDTDESGFIRVNPDLRSISHAFVFAAGDVAAYTDPRPKSGVYAVRAGPVLAGNLRAACAGKALQAWTPQTQALYLIGTGRRHALAARGKLSAGGYWIWRWKDWIDRRFIQRFS